MGVVRPERGGVAVLCLGDANDDLPELVVPRLVLDLVGRLDVLVLEDSLATELLEAWRDKFVTGRLGRERRSVTAAAVVDVIRDEEFEGVGLVGRPVLLAGDVVEVVDEVGVVRMRDTVGFDGLVDEVVDWRPGLPVDVFPGVLDLDDVMELVVLEVVLFGGEGACCGFAFRACCTSFGTSLSLQVLSAEDSARLLFSGVLVRVL